LVYYKGDVVGEYTADILVEDKVNLELKAVDKIQKIYEAQLLNYLKATGIKGLRQIKITSKCETLT
jgi:GxxExxY protein